MNGFQALSTGAHCIQMKSALRPMARFIEMMMIQITVFIHPSVNRSKVNAKLVLDQMAAVMEKVPAISITISNLIELLKFSGKSQICKP